MFRLALDPRSMELSSGFPEQREAQTKHTIARWSRRLSLRFKSQTAALVLTTTVVCRRCAYALRLSCARAKAGWSDCFRPSAAQLDKMHALYVPPFLFSWLTPPH